MCRQPRILIVDESWFRRRSAVVVLKGLPAIGEAVSSAEEALARMRTALPDAVVINLDGSKFDGRELRRTMLRDHDCRSIPAISTSRSVSDFAVEGFNESLTIPFHLYELLAAVTDLLPAASGRGSLPAREYRILIVDDWNPERVQLTKYLWEAGYQLETVRSSRAALPKLQQRRPGVVLISHRLSGNQGFELYHRICNDPNFAGIVPVLLIDRSTSTDLRCLHERIDLKVATPCRKEELLCLLARVLEPRRMGAGGV